jgi:hypothetical protein
MFHNKEAGVSLIIVFFVMIVMIAVVFSITSLLYGEIKVIRNISNAVVSFYTADSGIEKVLYYDRNILPDTGIEKKKRGLCLMCDANNPSCPTNDINPAINCNCSASVVSDPTNNPNGCDPSICNDCKITFTGGFDNLSYSVAATIFPVKNPYDMEVISIGLFNNSKRAIDVFSLPVPVNDIVQ